MAISEDEIYSIMFTSLKHPVRRKILRMLAAKPMTFMEMVENLGVSTSHLTYHLESLGELVTKLDNGQYKLSSFGLATVSAMNGVEETPQLDQKKRWKLASKWKVIFATLMIATILLAGMSAVLFVNVNGLSTSKQELSRQNQQLLSCGTGPDKIMDFLQNMTQIKTSNYLVSLDSDNIMYRTDFSIAEETITYTLRSDVGSMDINLRYRNNHFSRYDLNLGESWPVFSQNQPNNILDNANATLVRYKAYSKEAYVTQMINMLSLIRNSSTQSVTEGNMTLQITNSGGNVVFYWMYNKDGIDFQSKGLQMTFRNNVLTVLTDGYFLFTVGNTNLKVTQQDALNIARNYIRTMTYSIEGSQVSGFNAVPGDPLSVQMVPHTRGNSLDLVPYWYVEMKLTITYAGGRNIAAVGIYADTGDVADVQVLSSSTEI